MKPHYQPTYNKGYLIPLMILIVLSFTLSACAENPSSNQNITLRVAVLPVLDALPMFVAQQEGLFDAKGVAVELIPVAAAPERDQLIASGQADGMINEILSTAFSNREQTQLQVVRYARAATPDAALFSILAAGSSDIQSVEDLRDVEIGVSEGTIIDYLTDRLLQAEGFSNEAIQTVAVPKISDRMSLLGTGELKAAMLPEPLTSLAIQQGARLIIDDTLHPEYSFSTITFRKAVIDEQPQAIRAFLAAIEEATDLINKNPTAYNLLLSEQNIVPPPLLESFIVPKFVTAGVPSEEQWNDMLAWAKENDLLSQDVSYSASVTAEFLP
ncbi:MAG TPA: ABC transporter substrate-binding protein [Anaerolineales bacterium]|nr:ABC transporter substrate-binding protein [Anaerolineales bacterium]